MTRIMALVWIREHKFTIFQHSMNGLSAVLWALALIAALLPLPGYDAQSVLCAVLLAAAGALVQVMRFFFVREDTAITVFFPRVLAVGFAFWALALVSVIMSDASYVSFIFFAVFSAFPLSFVTAYGVLTRHMRIGGVGGHAWFVPVLVGIGMVLCAVLIGNAFTQFYVFRSQIRFGLVHWPLANPNSMAGVLSLCLFAMIGVMLGARARAMRGLALMLAAGLFAAMLMTGSRGAFWACLGGLSVFAICVPSVIKAHWRCIAALIIAGVVAYVVIGMDTPHGRGVLGLRASEIAHLWNRDAIWSASVGILRDHMWLGTGIGTFFLYYPQYRIWGDGGDWGSSGLHAHNDVLQFAIEMGVMAPILFYVFIGLACAATVKALWALKREDHAKRVALMMPFCALGAMVVHAHITFHFHIVAMLVLSGGFLAFWFYMLTQILPEGGRRYGLIGRAVRTRKGIGLAVGLALLVFAGMFAGLQLSEIVMRGGKQALSESMFDSMSVAGRDTGAGADAQALVASGDAINHANRLANGRNAYAYIRAAQFSLTTLEGLRDQTGLNALARQMRDTARLQEFENGMMLLSQAELLNPRLSSIAYLRGRFAMAMDDDFYNAMAEDSLKHALFLNPAYLQPRLLLAEFYARNGTKSREYEVLKAGLPMTYQSGADAVMFYTMISQYAMINGDSDIRAQALQRLADMRNKR